MSLIYRGNLSLFLESLGRDREVGDFIQSNWLIIAIFEYDCNKYCTLTTAKKNRDKRFKKIQRRNKLKRLFVREPRIIINNYYYYKK